MFCNREQAYCKVFAFALALALFPGLALAHVNIQNPLAEAASNASSVNFGFFVVSENNTVMNCTLYLNSTPSEYNGSVINDTAGDGSVGATNITHVFSTEGLYLWNVICAGENDTIVSATNTYYYDATAPVWGSFSLPDSSGSFFRNGSSIMFVGGVADAVSGILQGASCTPVLDAPGVEATFTGDINYTNTTGQCVGSIVINSTGTGSKNMNFTVSDRAGNAASTQKAFLVDNQNPSLAVSSPASDGLYSNISVIAVVSDDVLSLNAMNYTNVSVYNYTSGDIVNSTSSAGNGSKVFSVGVVYGTYNITIIAYDLAGNSNTSTITNVTIDPGAPNITSSFLTEPDSFFSQYDSAAGIVRFNATITDPPSGTSHVVANLTYMSTDAILTLNMTDAGSGIWNGTFNASALISSLPFSPSPVVGYTIRIFPYSGVGRMPPFSSSAAIDVLFHDLGAFQGPPAAMSGCFKEARSFGGMNATNMSYIDNFNQVNLTQIMSINGSAACMASMAGMNQSAPWGDGFQTVGYINFTGVNMSTQAQSQAVMSAMGQAVRMQMAPPHSFQPSRIFVNSSNISALNVSAMVVMLNLPFSSKPVVLDDAGAPLAEGAVTWAQGAYSATYLSKIGDLTINVSGFSGYNASDTVAPSLAIASPAANYNSSSASVSVNVSANGTGSEIYTLSINITSGGTVYNYTSYSWNGSSATANTANCTQVPADAGSEVVNCLITVLLPADLAYTINVSAADYGAPSNTNSASSAFRVDTTAPVVAIATPAANSMLNISNSSLNFTALDSGSGLDDATCEYSLNGTHMPLASCANFSQLNYTEGVNTLSVYANDTVGNQGHSTITFLVNTAGSPSAILNTTTSATANETVYVTPTSPAANITMSSGATNVSLNFTAYNSTSFSVALPAMTINASTSLGNVIVGIPNGTVVSGPTNWNGTLQLPMVKANSSVTPTAVDGYTKTVASVVEIGVADYAVNLSRAVRILIPGQAGKHVGFQRGAVFTEIAIDCTTDSQSWADANVAAGSECKINSGAADLAIWTRHFTAFATFTQAAASGGSAASGSSSGGSGGGSVGGSGGASSSKQSSTASVDIGLGVSCPVTITREMASAANLSVLTTTLENTGGSGCTMSDFAFVDTIPSGFPALNTVAFNPQYASREGWSVAFRFPLFEAGESKTLTYSASQWVKTSLAKNFTAYSMSARKQQAPAAQPAANATAPVAEEATAWIPRKLPALPSEAPAPAPAAPAQAKAAQQGDASPLLFTALVALVVLAGLAGVLFYMKGKKKKGL
ncbi:MAG: hypothetical protein WC263_01565 [Candidatus Micrarchaeia archaeon]|jgi:uncharacterized membrane protein YgcG